MGQCDGQKPCGRCKALGTSCVYEAPVRQSKDMLRKELEELRRKQHSSEQVLSALIQPDPVALAVASQLRNGRTVDSISEWLNRSLPGSAEPGTGTGAATVPGPGMGTGSGSGTTTNVENSSAEATPAGIPTDTATATATSSRNTISTGTGSGTGIRPGFGVQSVGGSGSGLSLPSGSGSGSGSAGMGSIFQPDIGLTTQQTMADYRTKLEPYITQAPSFERPYNDASTFATALSGLRLLPGRPPNLPLQWTTTGRQQQQQHHLSSEPTVVPDEGEPSPMDWSSTSAEGLLVGNWVTDVAEAGSTGQRRPSDANMSRVLQPELPETKVSASSWTRITHDSRLVNHLLALYFCWEYPTFASLSKEHFLKDFQNGHLRYCSPMLVNALMALGCRFSSQPSTRADENDRYTAGDHFFKESLRLYHQEADHHSLTTIQALGIMSIREASCGRDSESWYYSGQSMRLALEMGLHQNTSDGAHDDEMAVRSATFWGAFSLDQAWSLATGSLPQLSCVPQLPPTPAIIEEIEASSWVPYTDDGKSPFSLPFLLLLLV